MITFIAGWIIMSHPSPFLHFPKPPLLCVVLHHLVLVLPNPSSRRAPDKDDVMNRTTNDLGSAH